MSTPLQSDSILRTKLYASPVPADYVSRDRLINAMDKALEVPVTLVSAPAGYGKSVLVSDWAQRREHPSAWLSLDEGDSDLRQFVTYLTAAIDTAVPGACHATQELLVAPELPSVSLLASYLINDLDKVDGSCVVVLEDYHRLDRESPVHEFIAIMLEHPLPRTHIVLITRRDPPLPLTSLRAGNQLAEIRLRDLRFVHAEIVTLLAQTLNLEVSEAALDNLQHEIEGWAAGLRLVSLALRNAADPEGFLKTLHGGIPQTQEYLVNEVLVGLPSSTRDCILKSSILDRFCADLIDTVCWENGKLASSEMDGEGFVKLLRQSNLFTLALDSEGRWFRYHNLFQTLLQRRLQKRCAPGDIEKLHLRASAWFEDQHLVDEAILHARKAGEASDAADIVERHYHEALNQDRFYVLERWLKNLPAQIRKQRPALSLGQAYVAFFRQQTTQLVPILDRVESLLDNEPADDLRIELNFFRGYLHFWEGETEQSERELEMVVQQAPEHKQMLLAEAEVHLSLARYVNGNKTAAIQGLSNRIQKIEATGSLLLPRMIGATAIIHLLSGNLPQARFEARRMRETAIPNESVLNVSWGHYLEGLGDLHRMDLDSALDHFAAGSEHPHSTDARAAVDALAGLALTQQLTQQTEAATATVQRLIDFTFELNDPFAIDAARSCQARIQLLQGNLTEAFNWAKSVNVQLDRLALLIWLQAAPITQARVLIACGSPACLQQAAELLQQVRDLSEASRFTCQIIEVAVLQSLLLDKQGRKDSALISLEQAVAMAAPGGWVRPFAELGRPMTELLAQLAVEGAEEDLVQRVLASVDTSDVFSSTNEIRRAAPSPAPETAVQASAARAGPSPDGLTNRELDILELLMRRFQNKEIAAKLFISTHTVNYHLKHIYQKLGVSNRRQAVTKAAKIGILPPA